MQRQSLYFTAPFETEIRTETLPTLQPDQLLIETHYSAISAGTEMLLYRGEMPLGIATDTSIAALAGTMQYPLKYGYACVGKVVAVGRETAAHWLHRMVFAFNPHETHFITTPEAVQIVPDGVAADVATLLPNMETAVSFAMDGRPVIGERVVIFGQGIVGLLTTMLLAQFPLSSLTTVDLSPQRRALSLALGAQQSVETVGQMAAENDLVYELTGNPHLINHAISILGYNGRIIVGSWYGTKVAPLRLGDEFHRNGIQLISSQVSALHPRWRGRWTKSRRLETSWEHLHSVPKTLLTNNIPFMKIDSAYQHMMAAPGQTGQIIVVYQTP